MKRVTKIHSVVTIFFFALIIFASTSYAVAYPTRRPIHPFSPSISQRPTGQARRDEGKLKSCKARGKGISKRSDQLTKMANNMLVKFDAIAQRVEDYYTSKVVPSGKTVPNYNNLVSDIAAKKTTVQTTLTAAQNDVAGFSCTSGNPKGQILQFREDMKKVKEALRDFRTAIKNLIVAVHSVNSEK
ncbi:hypothetical protein HY029_06375 [Candidatus Gottesmanbacteria bacterium]|nr:hypothetical protein [Candidatus Gottesmanbacteria bacterium]